MNKTSKLLFSILILTSTLNAEELISEQGTLDDILTRTNISFGLDDNGNINPSIFVPIYYGNKNQFFSGIGYSSGDTNEVSSLDNFSDSKNSLVSSSKDLLLNYISYKTFLFGLKMSMGVQSTFSKIENNEFGYIHDSNNVFGNGTDYYVSFDNSIDLNVQRHSIRADIELPIGSFFQSRLSTSVSPYTQISVDQSTIFKPLSNETGTSSSSTVQDISYNFMYEIQIETGTFFDIGLIASYDNTPYKYDLAQLDTDGSSFFFTTNTVDTTEVTTTYSLQIRLNQEVLGGLHPLFGYGITNISTKDNISGKVDTTDKKIFTIGLQRSF